MKTDLLGRPLLKGGVAGQQQLMFDKEKYKNLKECERINAADDLEGQLTFYDEGSNYATGSDNK